MQSDAQKYALRGVSANKTDVHNAIQNLDKGLFPTAFCKILPDFAAGDSDYCNIMHADTAGTKTSLAYIYWRETGDLSVWRGIVQDSIVMNLDDMACVGCTNDIILSSTIGRNKNLISGDVVKTLIEATVEFAEKMRLYGVNIHLAGGETADVGDIVRTIDVGYTAFARMKRRDLVINDVQVGDVIVGFSSSGQAVYEDEYNGGMGSNGLTSARHDVLNDIYQTQYPESFSPETPLSVVYTGNKKLTDTLEIENRSITVGKLLLSPTRTYLPLLKSLLENTEREKIHGIIHNTGGGQTKVLKFVKNRHIVKNNLFNVPPLFKMIQSESATDWREMYQVFNMGHRLEIYCDEKIAENLVAVGKMFNIDAQIIGYVTDSESNRETLTIDSPQGIFNY
ncbi:MAG: phosphoribosylformylglycinamidine cyclo-ligase [Saprospiraceae bacterium]|nr:phosphoribosylformylglycinamidine cyclo-ligase [Saprospiraceae bacterium]